VLLSYSDEGHVSLDELQTHLSGIGDLRVHELATIGRYRPNEQASVNRDLVAEYLLEVWRTPFNQSSNPQDRSEAAA
jgi:adenine-specific DNA-methyltransferase